MKKNSLVKIATLVVGCCVATLSGVQLLIAQAEGEPALAMDYGAAVKITSAEDEPNGLRFSSMMSVDDYAWFAENVGEEKTYRSVQFGMAIAPADYLTEGHELTEANLFGDSAIYDWATYDEATDKWVYEGADGAIVDGEQTPVRIVNIVGDKMFERNGMMMFDGALTDYEEANIVRDFVGRGWYALTAQDGTVTYEMASWAQGVNENGETDGVADIENNTRSMIWISQTAVADTADDAPTDTQKAQIKTKYFDTIKDNLAMTESTKAITAQTTVAGDSYTGAHSQTEMTAVATFALDGGGEYTQEINILEWTSAQADWMDKMSVDGYGVVTGKSRSSGVALTAAYFDNLSTTVKVALPIASRKDMDALGFAAKDGDATNWMYGVYLQLVNDIDYAVDVADDYAYVKDGYRMEDSNSDADLWDRYLIPIAASTAGASTRGATITNGQLEWGIFGNIGGRIFEAEINGNGYAIKNAVIPYGTVFNYATNNGFKAITNNNFIGSLAYGGALKNIAFTGLEFEDPTQVAAAGTNNPYYTDANTNNEGTQLKTNGYITGSAMSSYASNPVNYGSYQAYNTSYQAGLIGSMQNAIVENVYVEAVLKNGSYGLDTGNGLIVGNIDVDYAPGGEVYRGTSTSVKNCITKTAYWTSSNVSYYGASVNAGMGSVVGRNKATAAQVENCFTVTYSGTGLKAIDLTHVFGGGLSSSYQLSTNCAVYTSVDEFATAQASIYDSLVMAKYLN